VINKNFLLILVGLPASGKTTIANALKNFLESKFENFLVKIVDPDQIRNSLFPQKFNPKKEQIVREKSLNEIELGLNQGFLVISDDLNYYTSMRHDLKRIAERNSSKYFILHISTPLETCIKWNKKRGEPISIEIIHKINKKFDSFNSYNWDYPLKAIDPSKSDNLDKEIEEVINLIERNLKRESIKRHYKKEKRSERVEFHEELDRITRTLTGEFAKNKKYQPLMKRISKLRKKFIKNHLNHYVPESLISKEFLKYIRRNLNIEYS